jgi:pilus assembly protein CpaF
VTAAAVAGSRPSGDRALKERVHRRLVAAGGLDPLDDLDRLEEPQGPARLLAVRTRLAELLRDEAPLLSPARFERLLRELTDEVAGLGPLEPLLADPEVTEVMLNGPGRAYIERAGRIEQVALDLDAVAIVRLVERVVAPLGLRLDRASPMVDARLADGSRLHALIPPLALDGPCVTIRRFRTRPVDLDAFGVTGVAGAFLRWAVGAGWNLLVAGGTSAGKTTLLNSLSAAIPAGERIVTIEETAELRLVQPHVVRLEARPPNAEGAGAVSVRDLVRTALRMRPDRVVVGEVRGGEALDMLQALNTGHDGSLSTVHANGPVDVLPRLETLVLMAGVGLPLRAVRSQIGAAVDAVVHVARHTAGARRVEAIAEVVNGGEVLEVRPLFERRGGMLEPEGVPARPSRRADASPLDREWLRC